MFRGERGKGGMGDVMKGRNVLKGVVLRGWR